jgi:hypothetical protein
MNIRDNHGISRIKFVNYQRQYAGSPIFVSVQVKIDLDNYRAEEEIIVELSDIEEFFVNLNELNKYLTKTFYFQHIDEQLQIRFDPGAEGSIGVTGYLCNKEHSKTLNFSFKTDQSELPNLLKESDNMIAFLKNGL